MASRDPPTSNLPPSMGPGARPVKPGEHHAGSLLQEISAIRSHYHTHVEHDAVNISYQLNNKQRSYRIPFENMPVQGLTRSLCYGSSGSAFVTGTLVIDMIRGCENITGRPVTQAEAEGIAFYSTRKIMTMYIGQITGISIGAFTAWRTRKEMKFPFRKPKAPEKYENFPARFLPLFRGSFARAMWQVTRVNIYILLWTFCCNPFFRSIADTRLTVGLYSDQRTHNLTEAIKDRFDRLRSNRAQESATKITGNPQQQQPPSSDPRKFDDASPQGFYDSQPDSGQNDYAGDSTFTDGNVDTGLMSDSALSQRQVQKSSPNSWSRAQSRAPRSDDASPTSQSSDFFFDDASPTAGNDPDMSTPQPYSRQSGGSAWDRLRRQSSPPSSPQRSSRTGPTRETPDFETKGDSFSFSSSEGEKRLAREQAQKEFDAMLEKERNEGGQADYIRDMRATETGNETDSNTESAWSRRRRG